MISSSHLVLLPSFNTGPRLREVVAGVLRRWQPVLVVVDGSTDGSERPLVELARTEPGLKLLVLPRNSGKGAAVLAGARAARASGFTHALVMDADGQHPAECVAEFMRTSLAEPAALVLGRPIFPANMPPERRHGRKLSIGLVHLELLGCRVGDPLFGFRVYPLAPLLALLGPRRGGRRYDFDTEAAVRLGWAGVPLHNRAAPVRYFSRAEGGVSHFHYLRDNATLVWMHLRLLAELVLWRWPAVLRHRHLGLAAVLVLAVLLPPVRSAEPDPLVRPEYRLAPAAPAWDELTGELTRQPEVTAEFTERRSFPFRKAPVDLRGEVRISAARGLSLHYLAPEERTVILDGEGLLVRAAAGDRPAPADPRAAAANATLRHILRLDLAALEPDFELFGRRDGNDWRLVLVPRPDRPQGAGRITVDGKAGAIRRIEFRRSSRQAVEILIAPPRPAAAFSAEELKRYFR